MRCILALAAAATVLAGCGAEQALPDPATDVTVSLPAGTILTAQEALDSTRTALAQPRGQGPDKVELPAPIPASVFKLDDAEPIEDAPAWITAREDLGKLSELAIANGWDVLIEGFTDNLGDKAHNQVLSRRRADAVKDVIIKDLGYPASRVTSIGRGEAGDDPSNRKVTVTFTREES